MKKTETKEDDSNPFVSDSNLFERRNSKSALQERRAFLSMFQTFLASSISNKNEDKVQNLIK